MGDGTETDDDSDGEMPELESDSSSEDESSDWDYDDDTDEECDEQLGLRDRIRGTDEAHGPEDPADASWMREGLARAAAHDPEMRAAAGLRDGEGRGVRLHTQLSRAVRRRSRHVPREVDRPNRPSSGQGEGHQERAWERRPRDPGLPRRRHVEHKRGRQHGWRRHGEAGGRDRRWRCQALFPPYSAALKC